MVGRAHLGHLPVSVFLLFACLTRKKFFIYSPNLLTSASWRNLLFFSLAVFCQGFAKPGIMSSPPPTTGRKMLG
jgi:hypothetical protein